MRGLARFTAGMFFLCALVAACADGSQPVAPQADETAAVGVDAVQSMHASTGRSILMLDQCDPASFNAAIGAGSCVNRVGGMTFDVFIAQLEKHQRVASWIFSPVVIHVASEQTLPIINAGGEVHTFTEVEEFGGGIVPILNLLSGTPVPAPECLALTGADFVPAGGQTSHTFTPGESDKYMCCIHPWMRAVSR